MTQELISNMLGGRRESVTVAAGRLRGNGAPMNTPSREVPIDPAHAALLIVDVQNYCAHPDGIASRKLNPQQRTYLFARLRETVLPNPQRLRSACRRAHIEIVYAAVENMTRDGRDRSLDYKISGIDVPRGSWEAQVLEEIAPAEEPELAPVPTIAEHGTDDICAWVHERGDVIGLVLEPAAVRGPAGREDLVADPLTVEIQLVDWLQPTQRKSWFRSRSKALEGHSGSSQDSMNFGRRVVFTKDSGKAFGG